MNRENYPQSKEDFDTRLHRAQENNEAQGRVGNPGGKFGGLTRELARPQMPNPKG